MTVLWIWKAIYVLGLVFFFALALVSLFSHQSGPALVLALFGLLCGFAMILAQAHVDIDQEAIIVSSPPFGKYMIRWDEISLIETNGVAFVFRGNDKALGFNTLMGNKGTILRTEIERQASERRIEVEHVRQTPTTLPKNTRVS
jgi:hypothetical protein